MGPLCARGPVSRRPEKEGTVQRIESVLPSRLCLAGETLSMFSVCLGGLLSRVNGHCHTYSPFRGDHVVSGSGPGSSGGALNGSHSADGEGCFVADVLVCFSEHAPI